MPQVIFHLVFLHLDVHRVKIGIKKGRVVVFYFIFVELTLAGVLHGLIHITFASVTR